MYHTLAWTVSLADATLTDVTPVVDQIFPVINAHFMPPNDYSIYAGVALGTNLQRVRVTTPKIRQVSPVFIKPLQPTLIGANDPNHFLLDRAPLRVRGQEEIVIEAIQNSGGAQRVTIVACLGMNLQAIPAGDIYVIRATSTTACVANTWTQITYTLDSQLPQGRYAIVLIEHSSAAGQCIRGIFDNQFHRPGVPSGASVLHRLPYWWYEYSMGVMGYFVTYSLPRLEVLANGTDNAHEIYFHVIPLPG